MDTPVVIVELFTSEGCSSCPAADALLGELRQLPGVIALAYHVDYWDYLGWKDTLASPQNSQRQYDYARSRGDMDVYTPQIIVNGRQHVIGSDRRAVLDAIAVERGKVLPVAMSIGETDMELAISLDGGPVMKEATVWVIGVLPVQTVDVMRGENAGRKIAYYRTARSAMPVGMWSGSPVTIKLPKEGILADGCKSCVALLQQGKVGPVLGMAQWGDAGA